MSRIRSGARAERGKIPLRGVSRVSQVVTGEGMKEGGGEEVIRLIAQMVTAAVSVTWRQFKVAAPGFVNGARRLGSAPGAPPAYLARRAGK